MHDDAILRAVCNAINLFNDQLPADRKLVATSECRLVGSPDLDSADLVQLLVMIEQQVEQELGVPISLFEPETVDSLDGFATVEALVGFLSRRLAREDAPR